MLVAICSVALITGLLYGGLCCGKHTIMPMPLDTADHVQDWLRSPDPYSALFHERYRHRQPL